MPAIISRGSGESKEPVVGLSTQDYRCVFLRSNPQWPHFLQSSPHPKGIVSAKQVFMLAIPATVFLAVAGICVVVGRLLLVRKALGVGIGWLFTVLLVPFGPLFFGWKHPELARPTRLWRRAAAVLVLLFFLDGGNARALRSLKDFGKPGAVQESAGDTDFHLPFPSKTVAATVGESGESPAARSPGKPTVAPPTTSFPAPLSAAAAPAATPSPAVAAAIARMAPAPRILTREERVQANQREFEHLADWYDNLRHERGYLRKGDSAALDAYNAEVREYQAALQRAKTEEAALANLTAQK
jgi:hypothetical protein